jgi:hypothetical protein
MIAIALAGTLACRIRAGLTAILAFCRRTGALRMRAFILFMDHWHFSSSILKIGNVSMRNELPPLPPQSIE